MKKVFSIFCLSIMLLNSCDNNVSYIGEFEQKYSLNCILRSDRNIQFAAIKRSYSPTETGGDADVQNAVVKLFYRDSTFTFKDSLLSETHPDYSYIKSFYYLDNFNLVRNTVYRIEATLPDGTFLSSETQTPRFNNMNKEELENTVPQEGDMASYLRWSMTLSDDDILFGPSFYIRYFITGEEELIRYKEVPGFYTWQLLSYEISRTALDDAMRSIAQSVQSNSTINIINGCFEVKLFDKALGQYLHSIQTFEDEYSIRVAEANLSNIDGGFGIFGSYFSEKFYTIILDTYANSFGFTKSGNY